MHKAKELVILQNEDTGLWYLEPDWKTVLYEEGLGDMREIEAPYPMALHDVEDVLRLEVDRRNKCIDKRMLVIDWLYDLLTQEVEPAIMQEETEYISNVLNYLKFKQEHPEIIDANEKTVKDNKLKEILKSGMSFTKKLN